MRLLATRLFVLGLSALNSSLIVAAEQTPPDVVPWHGYYGPWHMHGHGFWWIFPLMMLFFMFLFFFFFVSRYGGRGSARWWRWMSEHPESHDRYLRDQMASSESAMEILNKRYVRGEIDKAEYEEKKATIAASEK